jgi:Uma2 family endonuclease
MASALKQRSVTAAEYLQRDAHAAEKYEFVDGVVLQMPGGTANHARIQRNLTWLVANHLRGHGCEAFGSDMKVHCRENGLYAYPDLSVACPPIEIEKQQGVELLLNPVVIIEVLSPSTEAYDRGKKWARYQPFASLREYILVSQDEPRVECLRRLADGEWKYVPSQSLAESFVIESLGATFPLADVYDKVEFTPSDETTTPGEPMPPTASDDAQGPRE